ncbi:hypothetical protein K0T92_16560 [Paenibacillus oenotherae]|uniref:Uncharacterized protein n=1 Tax=Paenibacillus oenotherae TaxID=1435645 RepID=A0ABS7D8R9_9BACL|nr:hypothetical protein [Paenibacillus oenotherae]MBW7476347.1 hypothetical protein [Paenibacillus oenotherae]
MACNSLIANVWIRNQGTVGADDSGSERQRERTTDKQVAEIAAFAHLFYRILAR